MKDRLAGANKGHSLLKRKAEALKMRFRVILLKIIEVLNFLSTKITRIKLYSPTYIRRKLQWAIV